MRRVTANFKILFFPYASLYFVVCEPGQLLSTAFFITSVKHHGYTWIDISHVLSYTVCKYVQKSCLKNYVYV